MTEYYLPPPADPSKGLYTVFDGVVRDDGAWIPNDPANTDWVDYQTWLSEGNTAQPYSAMPPPQPPAQAPPAGTNTTGSA